MKTKRPAPTPADDARRDLTRALGRWDAIIRWLDRAKDMEFDSDYDNECLVFAQGDIKDEIVGLIAAAAGRSPDEPAAVIVDGRVLATVPRSDDDSNADTHCSEGGFLVLPRDALVNLDLSEETDAALTETQRLRFS